ncbi:MAG: TetR/AcrR family transcriptional regulator [Gammaproteobacteria bacterium]
MQKLREPSEVQKAKSLRTHATIVRGVVACLDKHGYAETSISRVLEQTGISRGALQHHFRTKEDLIAATAEYLMQRSLRAMRAPTGRRARQLRTELNDVWHAIIHTRDYRALLEILNAMRTDKKLRRRILTILKNWNASIDEAMLRLYTSTSGSDEEVIELMAMSRCLLRGLVIEESFAESRSSIDAIVTRWIEMLSPRLQVRPVEAQLR